MNRKWVVSIALASTGLIAMAAIAETGPATKPADATATLPIKKIMDKANKGPDALFKKVMSGKADAAQKQELLELYAMLGKNDPPKGDKTDWDDRTAALTKAAQGVVDDAPNAIPALKKAADCKACHSLHQNKH